MRRFILTHNIPHGPRTGMTGICKYQCISSNGEMWYSVTVLHRMHHAYVQWRPGAGRDARGSSIPTCVVRRAAYVRAWWGPCGQIDRSIDWSISLYDGAIVDNVVLHWPLANCWGQDARRKWEKHIYAWAPFTLQDHRASAPCTEIILGGLITWWWCVLVQNKTNIRGAKWEL